MHSGAHVNRKVKYRKKDSVLLSTKMIRTNFQQLSFRIPIPFIGKLFGHISERILCELLRNSRRISEQNILNFPKKFGSTSHEVYRLNSVLQCGQKFFTKFLSEITCGILCELFDCFFYLFSIIKQISTFKLI